MILGRGIIFWVISIIVAICIFVLAKWAIPQLLGAIGVQIPEIVASVIALLIAIGIVYGGYSYRNPGTPVA